MTGRRREDEEAKKKQRRDVYRIPNVATRLALAAVVLVAKKPTATMDTFTGHTFTWQCTMTCHEVVTDAHKPLYAKRRWLYLLASPDR